MVIIAFAAANIVLGLLFGYIAFKFSQLLTRTPKFIKRVLIGNFLLSLVIFLLSSVNGLPAGAFWRFLLAVVIFVYLMKSVDRLSKELAEEAPIQSPEPVPLKRDGSS